MKAEGGHGRILKRQGRLQDLNKDENLRAWRQEDKGRNMRQADSGPYRTRQECAEIIKHILF